MTDLNQLIIKFDYEKNFKDDDFYVSKSNLNIFNLLNNWPKWEKNFLNINGDKYSGKTHLVNIFQKKFKGIKLDARLLTDEDLVRIKIHQNIILEDLSEKVDERLIYSLFNIIDIDNNIKDSAIVQGDKTAMQNGQRVVIIYGNDIRVMPYGE